MAINNIDFLNNRDSDQVEKDFVSLILKLQDELGKRGIEKAPFSGLKYFSNLDQETKLLVVGFLTNYCKVIENIAEITEEMSDDLKFIWSAIKTYSFIPPSDFLSTYEKGSVFEIYNGQGQQIFRNFEFFNVVSYSLEQIFCLAWFEAYYRDEALTEQMFGAVVKVMSGEIDQTVINPIPTHNIKELQSDFKNLIEINITSGVPLKSKTGTEKFFGVFSKCRVLESQHIEAASTEVRKPDLHIV